MLPCKPTRPFARTLATRLAPGVVTLVLVLSACGQGEPDREIWVERGARELGPFKRELMGALQDALVDGPENAIDVCRHVAPDIADELRTDSVTLGRTSHRLRNPDNAPRDWVRPLLDEYVSTPGRTEAEVVRLEDGGVGYVEPIFMKSMCLPCHGSDVPPGVASLLDESYPGDQARGFEEGDFRGLFWVEFAPDAGSE